jgi:hypothetical protein
VIPSGLEEDSPSPVVILPLRGFFLRIEVVERNTKPAEDCAIKPTHARGASEGGPSLAGTRECSGRFRLTETGSVPRIKVGRGRAL